MTNKKIVIIPARSKSKRIPNKNIKDFFGKPIISYPISVALNCKLFDEVMVSTDCNKIADIAKSFGAKIPFLRSIKNSDDFSTTSDVIEEVILEYKKINIEFETICCIYPTAVFLNENTIKNAFNKFINGNYDSLIPVVKYSHPIQRALRINNNLINFIYPEFINTRSQDLEFSYHDCGQFYFLKTYKFLENKKIYCDNSTFIELNSTHTQDIDNEEDWKIAEIKYKSYIKTQY
ncbi:pseudaminic acid cytidylyltransferase [Alphaproteobacteria bacterium]|nr:pseudaminic acid cytidylyltransferase [Alphaproteobacteria bacterium]